MSGLHDYRLRPFARLTYVSLAAKSYWQPIVSRTRMAARPWASIEVPACCQRAAGERVGLTDPVWQAALRTPGAEIGDSLISTEGYGLLNPVLARWGVSLLPYAPCNYRCAESLRLAEEVLSTMPEDVQDGFRQILGQQALWDSWRGVTILKTPVLSGDADSDPYQTRRVVHFLPLDSPHPFGVVPHMAHGTEWPYLTRKQYRQIVLQSRAEIR